MFNYTNYLQANQCAIVIHQYIYGPFWKFMYPFIKGFSLIYLRFIDDIFCISAGNRKDLMKFLNELNAKQKSIKFEYQISKASITLLDTEVYIKNNKMYTKILKEKKADLQKSRNINSQQPKSLKNIITYSDALPIKRICSKTTRFEYYLPELKERLWNKGYNKKSINQQFSKVKTIDKNELLKEKAHSKEMQSKAPVVLTYNRFLPNISNIVRKHLNILNISRTLQRFFQEEPTAAFKRNRNLKEFIGGNSIEKEKVKRAKNTFTIGKCSPCLSTKVVIIYATVN